VPNARIKHIVVLMLENRSFDHMLGFLKAENPEIRGVAANDYSNADGAGVDAPVTDGAAYQGQLNDPGHNIDDVYLQMYGVPLGTPLDPGVQSRQPTMSGFVRSYEEQVGLGQGPLVMRCFRPQQLPNLSALARSYVVCDAWFSSVPGPTIPNRAFAHFGTSFGRLDMAPEYFRAHPSIYQRLRQTNKVGKIYYYDQASSTMGLSFLLSDQSAYFGQLDDFERDCRKNTLPEYSFVEPNYKDHGDMLATDQHPDNSVSAGDTFIGRIYSAIRANNKVWESTVFVITWDEHGGLYDHQPPPALPHVDGFPSTDPNCTFDRLGVRVPAIVVSPYVRAGEVDHTVYEHASIPATVTEQFIGPPQVYSPFMREKWAATFLHLLRDQPARQDFPDFAARPSGQLEGLLDVVRPEPADVRSGRSISSLLREQVNEAFTELRRQNPGLAAGFDPDKVTTHQESADFMQAVFNILHPTSANKRPAPNARARKKK
jgi:phospholipase C